MFNCLQEGIIVIQGPEIDSLDDNLNRTKKRAIIKNCNICFINDLGMRIFSQIKGIKDYILEKDEDFK
jgi:hypothetical protein